VGASAHRRSRKQSPPFQDLRLRLGNTKPRGPASSGFSAATLISAATPFQRYGLAASLSSSTAYICTVLPPGCFASPSGIVRAGPCPVSSANSRFAARTELRLRSRLWVTTRSQDPSSARMALRDGREELRYHRPYADRGEALRSVCWRRPFSRSNTKPHGSPFAACAEDGAEVSRAA
jgi:hypothetical protein